MKNIVKYEKREEMTLNKYINKLTSLFKKDSTKEKTEQLTKK